MPAPHRRSHNAKATGVIDTNAQIRAITNPRTRKRAMEQRAVGAWERAEASRPTSDLARKAAEVRTDAGRAKQFQRFDNDVRKGRAKPPVVVLTPKQSPRYWLGHCIDCDVDLWVHAPKPRVPLCAECWSRR